MLWCRNDGTFYIIIRSKIRAVHVLRFIFCVEPVSQIILKASFSADCLCQTLHHCEEWATGCEEQTHRRAVSGLQVHFRGINSWNTYWFWKEAWTSFPSVRFGFSFKKKLTNICLSGLLNQRDYCTLVKACSFILTQELWGLSTWKSGGVSGCEWREWLQHRSVWTHDHQVSFISTCGLLIFSISGWVYVAEHKPKRTD